jgi:hypothetical protein
MGFSPNQLRAKALVILIPFLPGLKARAIHNFYLLYYTKDSFLNNKQLNIFE